MLKPRYVIAAVAIVIAVVFVIVIGAVCSVQEENRGLTSVFPRATELRQLRQKIEARRRYEQRACI